MNPELQGELYPIPLPPSCTKLRDTNFPKKLAELCDRNNLPKPAESDLTSSLKHVEVITETDFDCEMCASLLEKRFPNIVWSAIGKEDSGNLLIYSFEFLPVSKTPPLFFTLSACLEGRYRPFDDVSESFVREVIGVLNDPRCQRRKVLEVEQLDLEGDIEKIKVAKDESEISPFYSSVRGHYTAKDLPKLVAELKTEHHAKERMVLANQKMELLMAQLEAYQMNQAMSNLSEDMDDYDEDWAKWLRIDLREYTVLMQKAKFLQQLWTVNRELETRTERMTISEKSLTYERQQVKRIKDRLTSHEVYLVLDECQEIQKRCKIRSRVLFGKPYVRIMSMDYENLRRKAQYFDLLQGENVVLERVISSEQPV